MIAQGEDHRSRPEAATPSSTATLTPHSTQQLSPPPQTNVLQQQLTRPREETFLSVKIRYRGRELAGESGDIRVTNESGFRLYFGNNVHNFSSLLDPNHLRQLIRRCKTEQQKLFGPDQLQQIRVSRSA